MLTEESKWWFYSVHYTIPSTFYMFQIFIIKYWGEMLITKNIMQRLWHRKDQLNLKSWDMVNEHSSTCQHLWNVEAEAKQKSQMRSSSQQSVFLSWGAGAALSPAGGPVQGEYPGLEQTAILTLKAAWTAGHNCFPTGFRLWQLWAFPSVLTGCPGCRLRLYIPRNRLPYCWLQRLSHWAPGLTMPSPILASLIVIQHLSTNRCQTLCLAHKRFWPSQPLTASFPGSGSPGLTPEISSASGTCMGGPRYSHRAKSMTRGGRDWPADTGNGPREWETNPCHVLCHLLLEGKAARDGGETGQGAQRAWSTSMNSEWIKKDSRMRKPQNRSI